MQKLTLREMQQEELKILVFFDEFCCQHGIRYSLADGTLLGAVRHKGFIPWDDDVDVYVPREDYERLLAIYEQNDNYRLLTFRNDPKYPYPFAKICSCRTYLEEECSLEEYTPENMGVYIDIFPTDLLEAPDSFLFWWKNKRFHTLISTVTMRSRHNFSFRRAFWSFLLKMLDITPYQLLCAWEDFAKSAVGKSCTTMGAPFTWGGGVLDTEMWDHLIKLEFEGHQFWAFEDYDTFLTKEYGDYMTPPPPEKRESHDNHAYWRNHLEGNEQNGIDESAV